MDKEQVTQLLGSTLEELDFEKLREKTPVVNAVRGKVRDIAELDGNLLIVTTDRISAFDKVLTTIPCKGATAKESRILENGTYGLR